MVGTLEEVGTGTTIPMVATRIAGIIGGLTGPAVVVAASRADVLVLLQIGFVEHGLAAGAFDPQALGHAAALGRVGGLDFGG